MNCLYQYRKVRVGQILKKEVQLGRVNECLMMSLHLHLLSGPAGW